MKVKNVSFTQELAISNMLEIETLRQLLFEKGIITEEEFVDRFKKVDREMKEKGGREIFQDELETVLLCQFYRLATEFDDGGRIGESVCFS